MLTNGEIAAAMAENMSQAAVPLYGKKLHLPDRNSIIGIIKELRRLFFPAYFGEAQLMALPAESYAALLLERIETALTAQVALSLPEDQAFAAGALTHEILEQLPRIQQMLMTDIEATFDGDPAAADKEEIIFAYPGLFAIFVYRVAHELYLRRSLLIFSRNSSENTCWQADGAGRDESRDSAVRVAAACSAASSKNGCFPMGLILLF